MLTLVDFRGIIKNLSSHSLSVSELSLLSKGLNFIPTPATPEPSEFQDALGRFAKSLDKLLHSHNLDTQTPQHPFKKAFHSENHKTYPN